MVTILPRPAGPAGGLALRFSPALSVLVVIRHPVGGIRTYLKYIYGKLDPAHYRFTIITVDQPEADCIKSDLSPFDLAIVKVSGKHLEWRMLARIIKTLRQGTFRLIHSHGFVAGLLSAIANLVYRIPHVTTSHDIFRPAQFDYPLSSVTRRLVAALLAKVDIVQCVGEDAYRNLLDYLPWLRKRKEKLVVIRNGVSVDRFEAPGSTDGLSLKASLNLPPETVLFGFLGRFMPQKGFDYVIEAAEKLSKNPRSKGRFKILAVNDGAFVREYKSLIDRKGLSDSFVFQGFVPEVNGILSRLDALLVPSLWEACCLIVMEAFVAGCPLIASQCIGIRELLKNSPAIKIDSGNAESLANAMLEFMENRSRYARQAAEFAGDARRLFDAEETARQLENLFNRLLAAKPPAPTSSSVRRQPSGMAV